MFITSQASAALGLSVCTAMSIHNLTEGFMIALPLYYATRSRMTAFSYAAVMGGLSQPFGALIGLYLIRNISKTKEDLLFGIVFGGVSGMMSLITIQVSGHSKRVNHCTLIDVLDQQIEHVATSHQSRQSSALCLGVLLFRHFLGCCFINIGINLSNTRFFFSFNHSFFVS